MIITKTQFSFSIIFLLLSYGNIYQKKLARDKVIYYSVHTIQCMNIFPLYLQNKQSCTYIDYVLDVIKKGNVESLPIQETNSKDSSTNENFENHKKRKSKKNINLPLIKKKKKVKFEIDIDKKSKTKKNEDVTVGANLKNIMSNTFTKTTKKQKEENDNCVESDNNSNSFGKRNSSKSP